MKHLRSDYDAIQPFPTSRARIVLVEGEKVDASTSLEHIGRHMDPIIPEDEPVFLLRAKDPAAPQTVRMWAYHVEQQGGDPVLIERVRQWADEMDEYRLHHYPAKTVADVPEGALRG